MAAMPPAAGSSFNFGAFAVQLGASYLLGRLTAQDGPRLQNKDAAGGEYGVAMPRLYGQEVRTTGIFIAQDETEEHEHSVEDYSELVGAATGAIQGFMIAGPVGAVVGAVAGALFGAATPDQKIYTYSSTFALMFADRAGTDPVEGIDKLWAAGKLLFSAAESTVEAETFDADGYLVRRAYGKNRWFESLTIYGGGAEQTPDPILEERLGEQPAYRHVHYIVIEQLQLGQFGNSVPPVEGLVKVKTGETLADAAEAICGAAGIDPIRNLSTTAMADQTVRGYAITDESTCWDAIKPLLPVYRVDAAEAAGQVRFNRRTQTLQATIPQSHMGAHAYGDSPTEVIRFRRSNDTTLPREAAITFLDPERSHQPNTLTAQRSEGDAYSNISTSLALTLTADEGATAAATMLWDAWLGRTAVSFMLTDRWVSIEPGRAYAIKAADIYVPYRITRKTRGANGIIEVDAVSDEAVTYQADVAGTSGVAPVEEPTTFPDTRIVVMDMPITADDHDDYGFYVAAAGSASYWNAGWVEASGNGTTFAKIISVTSEAVLGDVTGTLAAGTTTGLDDTLDTTSTLTVVLLHDQMVLESVTDAQLDAWANFAYVGKDGLGEYLQFKTATKVGTATWELTNLRRGRKGTDHAITTHASGEEFALLGKGGVYRIVYADIDSWGDPLTLRGVTLNQDSDDADDVAFTNTGEGKRPYSPVNVEGSWDGSNNLTITFDARSRLNSGELGVDDNEEWEVEITTGAGRVELTATESWIYTAADQTTDGITPGDSISGRVRQTSDVNDGRWRNFTLVGPLDHTADTTAFTADHGTITADIG